MKKPKTLHLILLSLVLNATPLPLAVAAPLDAPAAPTDSASGMVSTEDIYNRLTTGAPGAVSPAPFSNPATGPAPTGKTLDQIMAVAPTMDNTAGAMPSDVKAGATYWGLRTDGGWGPRTGSLRPAPVAKSGQTTSYAAGDDGAKQQGVAWPTERFTDNGNGTVTDTMTGLIWLKNVGCFTARAWSSALSAAATLNSGECGLSDGTAEGAWRLPQVRELQSLIDKGKGNPALPAGHPFTGAPSSTVWSSTTAVNSTTSAWTVSFASGLLTSSLKTGNSGVWPVRGGQ